MKLLFLLIFQIISATETCEEGGDNIGRNLFIVTCDADGKKIFPEIQF